MNLDTLISFGEWTWFKDIGKNILFVAIALGVSTLVVWLLQLLFVAIHLFHSYWTSLEDED